MYKNSSTSSNNTTLWHYLGTKRLDYRHENYSTPGVLIEEYDMQVLAFYRISMVYCNYANDCSFTS